MRRTDNRGEKETDTGTGTGDAFWKDAVLVRLLLVARHRRARIHPRTRRQRPSSKSAVASATSFLATTNTAGIRRDGNFDCHVTVSLRTVQESFQLAGLICFTLIVAWTAAAAGWTLSGNFSSLVVMLVHAVLLLAISQTNT